MVAGQNVRDLEVANNDVAGVGQAEFHGKEFSGGPQSDNRLVRCHAHNVSAGSSRDVAGDLNDQWAGVCSSRDKIGQR